MKILKLDGFYYINLDKVEFISRRNLNYKEVTVHFTNGAVRKFTDKDSEILLKYIEKIQINTKDIH